MPNTEYLTESAEHWEALAAEALRMAEWDDAHIGSGAPSRHKADTYKRAAEAIRLEIKTGKPHCVCCHKPLGKPSGVGALSLRH